MNHRKNPHHSRVRTRLATNSAIACVALLAAFAVKAQSSGASIVTSNGSLLPYTSSGYIGVNGGVSSYRGGCVAGFGCDDSERAFKAYTGGTVNEWLGAEVGYVHMGSVARNGGSSRAHGINLSLVGKIPVGQQLMLHGRLGTTYGRTHSTAAVGGLGGNGIGWGPAWGFGAGLNINPQWAVVLDWDQHRFEFPTGKDYVSATTLGVRFKF